MDIELPQAPIVPEKSSPRHVALFLIGIVVVVVLIGVLYSVMVNRSEKNSISMKPSNVSPSPLAPTSDQQLSQDMQSVQTSFNSLSQDESSKKKP